MRRYIVDKLCLFCAIKNNCSEIASLLINRGAPLDNNGNTPLHDAIRNNCSEIASLLINRGAALDVIDIYGNTPLHLAF